MKTEYQSRVVPSYMLPKGKLVNTLNLQLTHIEDAAISARIATFQKYCKCQEKNLTVEHPQERDTLKNSERRAKLLGLNKPEFAPGWKTTIVMLLQRGDVTQDRVISDFGVDVANELFELSGTTIIDAELTDV